MSVHGVFAFLSLLRCQHQRTHMRKRLLQAVAPLIAVLALAPSDVFAQTKEFKGVIRGDLFFNISTANTVANVTNDPRYPNNPTETRFLKFYEFPPGADDGSPPPGNVYDNYGARLWGFLTPKDTAEYVFFVASDDPSELWLSTDDKEANKKLLALEPEWNGVRAWVATSRRPGCPDNGGTKCENRSNPVKLEANKKYFIEAIFKEGLGGDNLAVTWIKKGDADPEAGAAPLTGDILSAVADTTLKITVDPKPSTRDAGSTAKFSVNHNSLGPDSPITYQWKKNGSNIAGATSAELTLANVAVADNGAKITVTVTAGGQNITSKEAILTVLAVGPPILTPGFLKFDYFPGIPGNPVQNLLDDPNYAANAPGETYYISSFNSRNAFPDDSHEAYGARISGLFSPPETGQYEFFARSDDASQLFLSTDDKEANLQQIAEETGCCGAFEETGATETSAPIQLQAGKRYFIQLLYKEGGGGDWAMVAFRKVGDPAAAATLQPISGAFLAAMMPSKGSVTITKQPVAATVAENDVVKFSVDATASHTPLVFTWSKNGVPLATTAKEITVGPVKLADNGAKIKAIAAAPGAVAESAEVTLTVTQDKTPPAVAKVTGSDKFTQVTVVFSEAVNAATATTAANYAITGLTISAAKQTKPDTIVLTTSKQAENTPYTLTVKNVTDTASPANPIATAGATKAFSSFKFTSGLAKWEAFRGIGGNAVSALTDSDKFKNDQPDEVRYMNLFEGVTNYDESYGVRLSGYVIPATTGRYQFFLSTDDNGELWVSTDDNPVNKALVATEPQWGAVRAWTSVDRRPGCPDACENRSGFISLTAGRRYYTELLYKEGGGGDNGAITWRLEGAPLPADGSAPLGGNLIGHFVDPSGGKPTITKNPESQTIAFGSPATLKVSSLGSEPLSFQWQRDGVDVKGATSDTLTISSFSASDIGRYRVTVKNAEGSATSDLGLLMAPLTAQTGALYIEAEDFDFDGGKYVTDQPIGVTGAYAGGLYKDKGGTRGVDWNDSPGNDQPVYRKATGVEAGKPGTDGLTRAGFDVKVNHIVGWNDAGDWYNYTRQTPAGDYYVIGRLSSGEPNNPIKAQLDEVTAGHGTPNQTLKKIGSVNVPTTGNWDTFTFVAFRDDAGNAAKVTLGGEKTLRFTVGPTGPVNLDINYLLFIPAGPPAPSGPKLAAARDGANIKIEWTGTATLESADSVTGPWSAVANAKSPFSAPTTGSGKFYRLRQ